MSDHLDYINAEISQRAQRLAALEQDLVVLRAELRLLEGIKARLVGSPAERQVRRQSRPEPLRAIEAPARRKLGRLSHVLVKAAVEVHPYSLTTNEAVRIASSMMGEDVPRNNVRSSLWSNAKAKFLERVDDGVFRATTEGAKIVGMNLGVVAEHIANGVQAVVRSEGEADAGVGEGPPHADRDLLTSATGAPPD